MEVELTVSRYMGDSNNIEGFLLKLSKKDEKSSEITLEEDSAETENKLKSSQELISNEDKLKSSHVMEANFETIFNTIDDIFFAIDTDFNCIYWNKYAENLTGISRSEALGKSIYGLFSQLKGIKVEELYEKALKSQNIQRMVDEYSNSNGKTLFEINAYPSAGEVAVLIRDVSENKKLENDLKNEKNFYKSLVENQKNLVCVLDKKGSIIFSNKSFKKLKNPSNFKYLLSLENKKEFEEKFLKKINPNNINLKNNPVNLSNSKIILNWNILHLEDSASSKFLAVGYIADNYQGEMEALDSKNRDLIKTKKELQIKLAQMEKKLEKAEKTGLEILQENQDLKNEIQENINSKKIDSHKLELEINQLKMAKNDLNREIKQLKHEKNQNIVQIDQNEPSSDILIKELNENNTNLKKNLETSAKQANKLSEDNKLLKRELAEVEFTKSRTQKDLEEIKKEFKRQIGDLTGEIAQLKQINDSLSKEYTLLEKNSIKKQELLKNDHKILVEE
ncbi:MAG: PAS domain S-box protein, partial [Methanobacterium sp.]|nr:PAS domain S-box protein [Methanobacterium sp.]